MSNDDYPLVDVTGVRVLARHVVELTFDDNSVRVIDLEDWLAGPAFAPMRDDYDVFCAVKVNTQSGTIEFPNGADLSPACTSGHPAAVDERRDHATFLRMVMDGTG